MLLEMGGLAVELHVKDLFNFLVYLLSLSLLEQNVAEVWGDQRKWFLADFQLVSLQRVNRALLRRD